MRFVLRPFFDDQRRKSWIDTLLPVSPFHAGENPLGQSKKRVLAVQAGTTQYVLQIGLHDDTGRERLTVFFIDVDRLVSRLVALAEKNVHASDKGKVIVQLTPEMALSPQATGTPPDYFRITLPMSLLHRLWSMASGCSAGPANPTARAGWSEACAKVAMMAAFGHELNHAFTGHIDLPADAFQESNSDFRAGGLLSGWLQRADIRQRVGLDTATEEDIARIVVVACMMVCLIFGPATPGHVVAEHYPAPAMRFRLLLAGYIFYQEAIDASRLPTLQRAVDSALTWLPAAFAPIDLDVEARSIIDVESRHPMDAPECQPASSATRAAWYRHASLLRPILKPLLAIVRRDAKHEPRIAASASDQKLSASHDV
jgi:hypothetical protein